MVELSKYSLDLHYVFVMIFYADGYFYHDIYQMLNDLYFLRPIF